RRTGKARALSTRKLIVSARNPLHRRCARIRHRRPGGDSRLGGSALSRLALATGCAAARFHPAISPRFGTPVVDLEIWREIAAAARSEEHTSELQSRFDLVCRLLLEKKN